MAKLEDPNQLSSQKLTFLPFQIFHLGPILAAEAAHVTPLKNCDTPTVVLQKIFGLSVSYLKLISFFHSLWLSILYLLIQEANDDIFKSLGWVYPGHYTL